MRRLEEDVMFETFLCPSTLTSTTHRFFLTGMRFQEKVVDGEGSVETKILDLGLRLPPFLCPAVNNEINRVAGEDSG